MELMERLVALLLRLPVSLPCQVDTSPARDR